MPALVTNKFRMFNARQFRESFDEDFGMTTFANTGNLTSKKSKSKSSRISHESGVEKNSFALLERCAPNFCIET